MQLVEKKNVKTIIIKSSMDTIRITAGYIIDELQKKEKEIA